MGELFSSEDSGETRRLLADAITGNSVAIADLLERHRPLLLKYAELRLDPRVRTRVDATDVVQDAIAHAFQRFDDFVLRRPVSFRVWMLKTLADRLGKIKREHVLTQRRSVLQEVPLPDSSSVGLADRFAAQQNWRLQLSREELARTVRRALAQLADGDREIILWRYVEGLNNQEIGYLLDLDPGAVSKRHGRALLRLHTELTREGLGGTDK